MQQQILSWWVWCLAGLGALFLLILFYLLIMKCAKKRPNRVEADMESPRGVLESFEADLRAVATATPKSPCEIDLTQPKPLDYIMGYPDEEGHISLATPNSLRVVSACDSTRPPSSTRSSGGSVRAGSNDATSPANLQERRESPSAAGEDDYFPETFPPLPGQHNLDVPGLQEASVKDLEEQMQNRLSLSSSGLLKTRMWTSHDSSSSYLSGVFTPDSRLSNFSGISARSSLRNQKWQHWMKTSRDSFSLDEK